jgi:hypothetical protein
MKSSFAGSDVVVSLVSAAHRIATSSLTVPGSLSRRLLHAREIADVHTRLINSDDDRPAVNAGIEVGQIMGKARAEHLASAAEGTHISVDQPRRNMPQLRATLAAFREAGLLERSRMVMRALGAKQNDDGAWRLPNGAVWPAALAVRAMTDLSMAYELSAHARWGDFQIEWEPNTGMAWLAYDGPEVGLAMISIRVRHCQTLAEASALITVLYGYAVDRGLAELDVTI